MTIATVITWLKTSKFWVYSLLALGISILTLVLKSFFTKPTDNDHGKFTIPPPPAPIQAAVDKAEDDSMMSQAQAAATSEAAQKQLAGIAAVTDGVQRRKQLALFLQNQ